jgi:hypothetical protein
MDFTFWNCRRPEKKMIGTLRTCFYAIWRNSYEFYEIHEHFFWISRIRF